jgi:hypothetical protein
MGTLSVHVGDDWERPLSSKLSSNVRGGLPNVAFSRVELARTGTALDLQVSTRCSWLIVPMQAVVFQVVRRTREGNMMKVLIWAVLLLMAGLGLMAVAPAPASPAPDTQADVTYLHLLDQNGVSSRNPEAMVSYAHDLVDQLSASPQNDASVGSIVNTGEERNSQHDMGVIIAAAVVAYKPSLIPVVRHWADSAAGFPCGSAAEGVLR